MGEPLLAHQGHGPVVVDDRDVAQLEAPQALALALVLLRVGPRRWRPVVPRAAGLVGLAAMAVPASTYLLTTTRWFDSDHPMGAFVLRLAVIDLALVALTLAVVLVVLRWARPRWLAEGPAVALVGVGVLSAVTWLLLAGDLLVGRGRICGLLDGRIYRLLYRRIDRIDGGRLAGLACSCAADDDSPSAHTAPSPR